MRVAGLGFTIFPNWDVPFRSKDLSSNLVYVGCVLQCGRERTVTLVEPTQVHNVSTANRDLRWASMVAVDYLGAA